MASAQPEESVVHAEDTCDGSSVRVTTRLVLAHKAGENYGGTRKEEILCSNLRGSLALFDDVGKAVRSRRGNELEFGKALNDVEASGLRSRMTQTIAWLRPSSV
ncbi:MAG TPA: hypothetical protein VIV66_06135 [Pyrinomonadaceae bacterium]